MHIGKSSHYYRELDDFRWRLYSDSDLVDRDDIGDGVPPYLLLFGRKAELKRIDHLEFFTSPGGYLALERLVTTEDERYLDIRLEKSDTGDTLYAALKSDLTDQKVDLQGKISNLISRIFSLYLVTGRPLRHYNCTFFLPLDLALDEELAEEGVPPKIRDADNSDVEHFHVDPPTTLLKSGKENIPNDAAAHAQAYEFYYSHLQGLLFETSLDRDDNAIQPIVHKRLLHKSLQDMTLNLVEEIEEEGRIVDVRVTEGKVEDVSLYRYYNGIYLLSIRVGHPENRRLLEAGRAKSPAGQGACDATLIEMVRDDDNWWRPLVFSSDDDFQIIKGLQVESWLRYTKITRILFASFFEQWQEKKIAPLRLVQDGQQIAERAISSPFSPIVLYFIQQFLDLSEIDLSRKTRLQQVADERMFIHAAYALCGPTPETDSPAMEEFERLFSYALYVDQRTDGYASADNWAYDKTYTKALMEEQVLRRWQSIGSLSGYTDYSSVFMGFGSFFHNPTAMVHVPYIYAKIQILVLFYRATLHHFDRRITHSTRDLIRNKHRSNAFIRLHRDFIRFTNDYWFRKLSPQIQGNEISQRMMQQLSLNEKYELLKDEMDRAAQYTLSLNDRWFQKLADVAGWIAGVLAVGALILATFDVGKHLIYACVTTGVTLISVCCIFVWKINKDKD